MLFGSNRDFNLLVGINRELIKDVVEQEVLYYKLDLYGTESNIYGEALQKTYLEPVKLNCLVTRGDQVITTDEFGPDLNREMSFAFLREDAKDSNVYPEVGDIIMWHEDYFQVDTVRENQLFMGRDNSYNLSNYANQFGSSLSIIADTHLTRAEDTGITFNNMPNTI
jgi:hypothetical protein